MNIRLHCSALVSLFAPIALLAAAPPPELTVLRQQYEKAVIAPHTAAQADLDAKFIAALGNTITAAKQAGKLEEVLAIQDDQKRLTEKLPLPDDDEKTPESLKKLRSIYRDQLTKLEAQRAANHTALLPAYTAKLKALEANLTKVDRIDEAKEVMTYREGLAAGDVPAVAPTIPAGTSEKPNTATAQYAKGDDRKAAEWVLGAGGSVKLSADRKTFMVDEAQALPRGKFTVLSVKLKFFQGRKPVTPITDLLPLAGLVSLEELDTAGLEAITDEHLAVLSSLPALKAAIFTAGTLTDAAFAKFAKAPVLSTLNLDAQQGITGAGLASLTKLDTLSKLVLGGRKGLTEEGCAALAQLKQLRVLFLDSTVFGDAHLPALDGMKGLYDLEVKNADVTAAGIAGRKSLAGLKTLALSMGAGEGVSQAGAMAKACPALRSLIITGKMDAALTAEDIAALRAFPKLENFMLYYPGVTDATLAGISSLPDLPHLSLGYLKLTDACLPAIVSHKGLREIDFGEAHITDDGLLSLAAMKGLKQLNIKVCPKLTQAGIEAFKKKRPDVKLE